MRFGGIDLLAKIDGGVCASGDCEINEGFLKALLTFGTWDEYEFFFQGADEIENFHEKIHEFVHDPDLIARIKAYPLISLAEAIQTSRYDVFHLGNHPSLIPSLKNLRDKNAKECFPITCCINSPRDFLINPTIMHFMLSGLESFDSIICENEYLMNSLASELNHINNKTYSALDKNLNILPHLKNISLGIDDHFFDASPKSDARAFFELPPEYVVATSLSPLSPQLVVNLAPILYLVSKMELENKIPNLLLIIAGGGSDSDIAKVKFLIDYFGLQQKIIVFGNPSPDIKKKLIRASDFYLSIMENIWDLGDRGILKAMASGLPVVASDYGATGDIIKHGENGLMVKSYSFEKTPGFLQDIMGILNESMIKTHLSQAVAMDLFGLYNAILFLHEDYGLRKKLGEAARKNAQNYRWMNVIRSYESLWNDLARHAKNSNRPGFGSGKRVDFGNRSVMGTVYSSKVLKDTDAVSLMRTDENGRGPESTFEYDKNVELTFFPELHSLIISILANGNKTVRELKLDASNSIGATETQTEYHLIWLLKTGAIALEADHNKSHSRKHKVVVYTAITGGKDELMKPLVYGDFDYVCHTDRMSHNSEIWNIRGIEQISPDPRRVARMYKMLPHKHMPDYEYSLWVDGSHIPVVDVHYLIDIYLANYDIAFFAHPERNCIYDEAKACIRLEKDSPKRINEQVERYRSEGYPVENGLVATTIVLRRHNEPAVIKTMEDWWKELSENSVRDQLSFNYVAHKNGLKYATLPGDVYQNPFFRYKHHLL